MATATYIAEAAKFSRQLVYVVKLTVPGDVAGNKTFYFSLRDGPTLSHLFGQTVFPTLKDVNGRATKIRSEDTLTERANITLQFFDDPNAATFDSAVFSVTTGATFWKRLITSQEYVEGWDIEISRGFNASGFALADLKLWFKGRTEDISFTEQGEVSLQVKGLVALTDNKAPSPISDANKITADVTSTASSFTVIAGSEVTDPASLPSKDLFPVVLRLDPDTEAEEDVIVKSIATDTITVQDNYLNESEDFSDTTYWTVTTVTVTADYGTGPFGGATADKLDMGGTATNIAQSSSLAAASQSVVFSVWLKTLASAASASVTLRLEDNTASESADATATVTQYWTRFQVTKTFTSGASGNVKVKLVGTVAGADCLAFGAQLETGTTRGFYVGTTTNRGVAAGRAAFGTSAVNHGTRSFKEVLIYRNHLSQDGVHPAVIVRDLLNRGEVPVASVDEDSFGQVYELAEALTFRRGRSADFDPATQTIPTRDTTITESEGISALLKEVKEQALLDVWESEEGKATLGAAWISFLATDTRSEVTDENHLLLRSTSLKFRADERYSRVLVYFNKIEDTDGEEPKNYSNILVHLNVAGESVGGKKIKTVYSDWIYQAGEALFLAGKTLSLYLKGTKTHKFRADIKDDLVLTVGGLFELDSTDLYTKSGSVATRINTVWRVIQKTENLDSGTLTVEASKARNNKYGRIAPAGTADYDASSAAEKKYAFIADTNNQLGAGNVTGYVIL